MQILVSHLNHQEQLHPGIFGDIQLLRGAHYQDMENWPAYWAGLPPMWYATHAVAPILALADTRATEVHCFGSGTMRDDLKGHYNNPYPIETAIFRLADTNAAAEVTRALFHSARPYVESFNLYGSNATFEWQQLAGEAPLLFRLSPDGQSQGPGSTTQERIDVPDYGHRLPTEIA
jgi:predicted dehydrogenase